MADVTVNAPGVDRIQRERNVGRSSVSLAAGGSEKTPAMADLGDLKIPAAMRPAAEAIIALTDQVCPELLDEEYAGLARSVVAKLARKRP